MNFLFFSDKDLRTSATMATFEQVAQMLSDALPVADVCRIVREYAACHKIEWTKKLMKGVCEQIKSTKAMHTNLHRNVRSVSSFVYMSTTFSFPFLQKTQIIAQLKKKGEPRPYTIGRLIEYGILKKKSAPQCAYCEQKGVQLTFVHRIDQKSKLMCSDCDTAKIYTPGYATGFRALPNKIQQFIVEGLNDKITLIEICRVMHARRMNVGASYATLFQWMKRQDMH